MATICCNIGILLRQIQHFKKFLKLSSTRNLVSGIHTQKEFAHKTHILSGKCNLCGVSTRYRQTARNLATAGNNTQEERTDWIYSSDFKPDIDLEYISQNVAAIAESISNRKGNIDVHEVITKMEHFQQLQASVQNLQGKIRACQNDQQDTSDLERALKERTSQLEEAQLHFYQMAVALPNTTHPDVPLAEDAEPVLIEEVNQKRSFDFPVKGHVELGEDLDIIRLKNLGHTTGHRSYFLKGAGAMLEDALIRYTLDRLIKQHSFTILKVPDIIRPVVFESCGMRTKGLHTQVYKVQPHHHDAELCLAGTAEVGISGFLMNKTLSQDDLPMRLCATSRCYRAETAHSAEARGLYRVHQFTKVEMFCVTANETGEESEHAFQEFVGIQRSLFNDLGLHFQILDMPAHDLGAPAHRKFDMEAWMPHRKSYGEISSTSNCTDFQSRRLHIKYRPSDGEEEKYVYTLNGTACAVPRMIIAILENYQQRDGSVYIPDVLQPYMGGMKEITRPASGRLHFTRL